MCIRDRTYDGSMEDYPIRYTESRTESADGMYGVYGGFLFIGIFLGALFIAATVLIIYYKMCIRDSFITGRVWLSPCACSLQLHL